MADVSDAALRAHASRANGKVVLITGAASGIGRQIALEFASHGAKVVIGDIQTDAAAKVVHEITASGGQAVSQRCDVTVWEEQYALFKFAIATYGSVDIVVPNAGVTEGKTFFDSIKGPEPVKPDFKTMDINLIAVMHTTQLALFYFGVNKHSYNKAVIFIGSIASIVGLPFAVQYNTSKHALLGLMASLYPMLESRQVRVGVIAPFFTDTAILKTGIRLFLAGVPFAHIERVSGAALAIATDPNPETNGCVWTVPDEKTVFRMNRDDLAEGAYKVMMDRVRRFFVAAGWIESTIRTTADIFELVGTRTLVFAVAIAFGAALWKNMSTA